MLEPNIPDDESARLQALRRLALLDTGAEERFDRLTRLARFVFDVPITLVSLVDSNRQWFKSRQGLDACETPRSISFCGHAILADDIFYIPNALEDPRFADNPLVTGPPNIRAYAGAPLKDAEGHRVGTLCIIDDRPRDFSEEQLARLRDLADSVEAELARTQLLEMAGESSRLAMVAEHTDNAVIITDADGLTEWVNQGFERISGYTLADVRGKKPGKLLQGPDTDPATIALMRESIHAGESFQAEILNYHKNGTPYWLELRIQPVLEDGRLKYFIALETDITDRKQAEQTLRDSESRIRAIVDTVVDGIITIDGHGTVQTINPAAEKIFDYTADEVVGHNVSMLMPEPYSSEHDGYLSHYLASGEAKVIGIGREVEGRRKDGSSFPMELAVSDMEIHDEVMFTGIVRDITERKQLDRMKSEFVSTVSHELRTPLTSIRGALGLVLGRAADQLPAKARQMLEMANRNSERLTLLINDILDLEKIESGRLEFEFGTVDLVALARRAIEDNEGYAHKHDVRLALDTDLDTALVSGDEHRLLQVFANLISNAVKYSPQDDQVEVELVFHNGGYRISICDHGSGIPETFRSKIFQRFAQADSSDTREKGGTGLGLSITKAIVERHDGSIGYESEPGAGTTFHFDLPAVRPDIIEDESATAAHVLICEDNPDVATILAEMLKQEGVAADIAHSAQATRTLLAKQRYRLLLLDLGLPDANGLELLQELRNDPATANLPVIVVSGQSEEGKAAFKGNALRVVDWLQKPVEKKRLERALHEAMARMERPHILHVEDDPDIVQVTKILLEEMADISHVPTVRQAREQLGAHDFDLVILDLGLADGSGLELLDELKGRCPVVIFSAQSPAREVTAQVTAALTKSTHSNEELLATIKRALREHSDD